MIKEVFIGRCPSHFQINPTVKAFIVSESIFWSSWNFTMPIFAVFATNDVKGGSIEVAASTVSIYLIVRVIVELVTGRLLGGTTISKKFFFTMTGMLILCFAFLGFALTKTVPMLFFFYGLAGVGMGLSSPAKNSLFSTHLDKNKETTEWGIYDASVFVGMAASTALGGFIAKAYGFQVLFLLSAIFTFISIIPYLLYVHKIRHSPNLNL